LRFAFKIERRKENMPYKTKMTAVTIVIFLMASVLLITTAPVVQAAEVAVAGPPPSGITPAFTTDTVLSISVKPEVIGLGQAFLCNVWLNPAVTTTRAIKTYTFTITQPDNETVTWNQDAELATAATWFNYVADQVGVWKIDVSFSGCYFNGTTNEATQSAYYRPSTGTQQSITCQQDIVPSWPPAPIPTDYWTRPVDFSLREWWPILGDYPAYYDGTTDPEWDTRYPDTNPYWSAQYDFTPWVQSPHSSHIAWIEQNLAAGVTGGQMGQGGNTIGSDLSTSQRLSNMICAGRGYRTVIKPATASDGTIQQTTLWQSYDIRTGEVFWEFTPPAQMPQYITYEVSTTTAAHSAGAVSTYLMYLTSGRMIKYNPFTGQMTSNTTLDPAMSATYYTNGYALSVQNLNSSLPVEERYRLINWTTYGTSSNFASRVVSNTSYARSSLPSYIDWQTGLGATLSGITTAGVMSGVNVTGFNLYTGVQLWSELIPDVTLFSTSCTVADHGKVAFNLQRIGDQYGAYMAYDLATGHRAWVSETMEIPWSSTGFGAYGVSSAYGLIIHDGYSGVTAINWTDGKIAWVYHQYSPAPFESPYTDANDIEVFSFNSGAKIADGTVYAYNCEHTTTFPRTRGWSTAAINVTTGEVDWSIAMPGNAAFGNNPDIGAIADGYMVLETSLGHFAVFGKGLSATTVSTPDVVVPKGTGVVIKGTVLDLSPAQPNTPCVAKESMTLQMEYLHLQQSIYGLWGNETMVGVPVTLTAIGADNSVYDLGVATTNGYSGAYSFTWTPPAEGSYEIYATFDGTEAYGSSSSNVALAVGPAPEPYPEPIEPAAPVDNSMLLYGILVAVIIAIVLALIALVVIFQKK
jgi:hypothetical protein